LRAVEVIGLWWAAGLVVFYLHSVVHFAIVEIYEGKPQSNEL
jgi:hypothetical protein